MTVASAVAEAGAPPRRRWLLPVLTVMVVVSWVAALGLGAVDVSPTQVVAIIADRLGIAMDVPYTSQQESVVWSIRLPRVALGTLVGAGLAVAGTGLQAIFRNPLAEPAIIGVSSGAALGAAAGIVLGATTAGMWGVSLAAFVGGVLATTVVFATARYRGTTEVVTLILTGIAVQTIAVAGTGLFTFVADDEQLRTIVFWTLGSLGGATWSTVAVTLLFVFIGVAVIAANTRELDLMLLGEREAAHLGVAVDRVRGWIIVATALATAATVAAAGVVGFVGLVAPHLVRMVAGPRHGLLVPAALLGGVVMVVGTDLVARTVVAPLEIPLGVMTALLGGPFFLFLIRRTRDRRGGWG